MADKKIKGITIEIGGETVGLQKALQDVNKKSRELSSELKSVEKLLKFDPRNVEALAQKQKILTNQIENTTKKLNQLKDAQSQVEQQFRSGEIGEEQYRKFRREVEFTEVQLNKYKQSLQALKDEQEAAGAATQRLEAIFKATGKSVDDFADTLGSKLVNAIKSGKASSTQLEDALDKIGQAALGVNADLDKMRQSLDQLASGAKLDKVKKDLDDIAKAASNAEKDVKGLGNTLSNVAGGLVAGGGLAGAINQALDTSRLNTQIDISFNVPEESKKAVKDAINQIQSYGIDGQEALEGVRRQWALNADASDEVNQKIVEGAGVIAGAYDGIDFIELIQEVNEIAGELKITDEEALALTNSLLKIGFPPEQLDIIAEYGQQLQRAGFDAQEIQAIMAAGIDVDSWNVDNLLDGVKEARISMAEFGLEVDDSMAELVQQTGLSAEQFQKWGKAVAGGGEEGTKAMIEMAEWLDNIENSTLQNEIAVGIFATKWEDQGQNLIDTLLNMNDHLKTASENQEELNDTTSKMDASPAVKLQKAFGDLKLALEPLLSVIANIVGAVASWMSANPQLAATITAIVGAIGIFSGALMALAPILYSIQNILPVITKMLPLLGNAFKAMTGPIGIAIGVLTMLAPLIIKNWEPIKEFFISLWDGIKQVFTTVVTAIGDFLAGAWEGIKNTISTVWNSIKDFFVEHWQSILTIFTGPIGLIIKLITSNWETIKNTTITVWDFIKSSLSTAWDTIKSTSTNIWNGIKNTLVGIWNGIKNTASNLWNGLKTAIITPVDLIKNAVTNAFQNMKDKIEIIWSGLKTVVKAPINAVIGMINEFIRGLNKIKAPDWVPKIGGKSINIPEIPMLAKGTNYFKGGYAIVGEQGPELVQLPTGAKVYPNKQTQDMLSNQTIITGNTFVVREEADIKKIARELYVLQIQKTRGGGIA